jgi:hypothetical protein
MWAPAAYFGRHHDCGKTYTVKGTAPGADVITMRLSVLALAAILSVPTGVHADGLKAVVFDIEPAGEALTPKVRARLTSESALVRKLMTDKGFTVIDTAPQAAKINANLPLSQCNGCDQDIAKALGADIEVTTAVQPSSSVIFNISGNVKDVKTNRVLREGVVDIRGEGEDVWIHGIKFLVKEHLLDPPLPADADALRKLVDAAPPPKE